MPQKQKSKSWAEFKQAGNESFKTGQYGEATNLYSQAIKELEKSMTLGEDDFCDFVQFGPLESEKDFVRQLQRPLNKKGKGNPEDLAILYSNRAAGYLKDGNCAECVKDCNMSLELLPFTVKSLLRRAAANEALERYRQAYVDYKTVLQIDSNITAAHNGANRMTKALTEADGLSWREMLPPIPTVPLSVRQNLAQKNGAVGVTQAKPTAQQNGTRITDKPADTDVKKGQVLKEEGNALVKKGEHKKAIEKYSQSLQHNPTEVTTYTNRALCYLSVKQYRDAVRDCDDALVIDDKNIKALYRRAQAHKELKDSKACVDDLSSLLKVEPNNTAAQKLLQEVQKK